MTSLRQYKSPFDRLLESFVPVVKLLEDGLMIPPEEWWDSHFPA